MNKSLNRIPRKVVERMAELDGEGLSVAQIAKKIHLEHEYKLPKKEIRKLIIDYRKGSHLSRYDISEHCSDHPDV